VSSRSLSRKELAFFLRGGASVIMTVKILQHGNGCNKTEISGL